MENYASAILSCINECIINDDLDRAGSKIMELSHITPDWTCIEKQLILNAVKYNSHKIVEFMMPRYRLFRTEDYNVGKFAILQYLINTCQSDTVAFLLKDDVELKTDIGQYYFDRHIDKAFTKLEELCAPGRNRKHENINCAKRTIKCLLKYPCNRYNKHGIVLKVDECTTEVTVTSNDSLDINKLINGKTLLEIWIEHKNQIIMNGCRTLEQIQVIVSNIIKYLIKHAVKMEAMGLFVSPNNERAVKSVHDYQLYKITCCSEVKKMIAIGSKGDTVVYFFHILTACKICLAGHAKNERIRKFFLAGSPIQLFPIYGEDIVKTFVKSINEQTRS